MSEILKVQESAFSSPLSTSDLHIDAGSSSYNKELKEVPFETYEIVNMAENYKSSSEAGPDGV